MKYVYLLLLLVISIFFMFGIALPYLISEKDTLMVLLGLVLMIAYCLMLLHIALAVLKPKLKQTEESNNEK